MLLNLSTIDRVKSFVDEISKVSADVALIEGKQIIDPKSIMGIFTMNLFKPITFIARSGDVKAAMNIARKYIA